MAYSARIVHKAQGRLRLKLEPSNSTVEDLKEATTQLRSLSLSRRISSNPITRTILLEDDEHSHIEETLSKAQEDGVIRITTSAELREQELASLRPRIMRQRADRFLRQASDGVLDSKRLFALVLGGAGIAQAISGKFLPAGMTLLFYAAGMLQLDEYGHQELDGQDEA